ncbi:MAG: AMP-binding protein [Cytophagaceae bacterium]
MGAFQLHINGVFWDKNRILYPDSTIPMEYQSLIHCIREWYLSNDTLKISTSGSTGLPKQIELDRQQIRQSVLRTLDFFQLDSSSTFVLALPLDKIAGRMQLYRALIAEATLYYVPPGSKLIPWKDQWYDFITLAPVQLYNMLQDEREVRKLNHIRHILLGGAEVNTSLSNSIHEHIATKVYLSYGMTETLSHVALKTIYPELEKSFKTLKGVTLSQDEHSCLMIQDDWLGVTAHTTDMVELFSPTEFKIKGRADFVINSGGIKIHPEELENKIQMIYRKNQWRGDFYVKGKTDERLGQQVIIQVNTLPCKEEHFLNILKQELPAYQNPKAVEIAPIVYSPNGKVIRH